MTPSSATEHEALALLLEDSVWLAAGMLVGAFHFLALRSSTRMLVTGTALAAGLMLHVGRFVVTAGALAIIARHGALPLLAATLGILASRTAVIGFGALP